MSVDPHEVSVPSCEVSTPTRCFFVSYTTRKMGTTHNQFQEALLKGEHPLEAIARWRGRENE
jgi:hypothetical protein